LDDPEYSHGFVLHELPRVDGTDSRGFTEQCRVRSDIQAVMYPCRARTTQEAGSVKHMRGLCNRRGLFATGRLIAFATVILGLACSDSTGPQDATNGEPEEPAFDVAVSLTAEWSSLGLCRFVFTAVASDPGVGVIYRLWLGGRPWSSGTFFDTLEESWQQSPGDPDAQMDYQFSVGQWSKSGFRGNQCSGQP
jgi:hypothetical protein